MTRLQPTFQQEYEEYVTGNYIACSLLALVAYEYVVTFDQEVACVWQRKFSAASLLLLSTRWVMLLYQIAAIIPRSQSKSDAAVQCSCQQWNAFSQLVYFTTVAQIALFSGLRVYALWHDSRFRYVLLAVVLVLGCVPIGTNIFGWTRMQSQWEGPPFSTCLYITHVSKRLNYIALRHQGQRAHR
ncbi:hypothetical protein PsYK624_145780 [Phanerochaete sordida]|uniref:DUF6533 domain-containing protein n=1 Tax=Phanerochaete sordida TaxID=48140 RepID=A0A9P3LKH3_9APHY|nr:hypothetical protein PsYK624_145780 [Phanerochaete sordida]